MAGLPKSIADPTIEGKLGTDDGEIDRFAFGERERRVGRSGRAEEHEPSARFPDCPERKPPTSPRGCGSASERAHARDRPIHDEHFHDAPLVGSFA
jgi:hypothetical protein